jgi:hypothetical protein
MIEPHMQLGGVTVLVAENQSASMALSVSTRELREGRSAQFL